MEDGNGQTLTSRGGVSSVRVVLLNNSLAVVKLILKYAKLQAVGASHVSSGSCKNGKHKDKMLSAFIHILGTPSAFVFQSLRATVLGGWCTLAETTDGCDCDNTTTKFPYIS
jgi:hypothetical protein